jgi:hypothetical protein
MQLRSRTVGLSLALTLLAGMLCPGISAFASAPSGGSSPRPAASTGKLKVGVAVLHFRAAGNTLVATGRVSGTLTDNKGHVAQITQVVQLTASSGGAGCKVLHLDLKELTLQLLGLNAHLDRVVLDITGNHSGILGKLFCKLSQAKVASAGAARATAAALNATLARHSRQGQHALRFSAGFSAVKATASAPSCQVLDLVVGPLNLELLGLVVDLQRVHLNISAVRGQGALGDLFCTLADNNTSGP